MKTMELMEFDNIDRDKVLVAKKVVHKGAMHGWTENGLPMLDLGNGYGLQIIATSNGFSVVQVWRYALNTKVQQQTYVPKKVIRKTVTKEVLKPEPELKFNIGKKTRKLF